MSEKTSKPRGLGRGLSALMADVNAAPTTTAAASGGATPDILVPVERIYPNRDQPRRQFVEAGLEELTESIRAKGVLQPLIVRHRPSDQGDYEIVAGERRWRAAQRAQVHQLPVLVREFSDTEVLEVAIIENIQRADLNPVEEAAGYRQLMNRFNRTQEQMSAALGKSRSHIANLLRLLNLPEPVQEMLREGQLSAGHARALITSDHPLELAHKIVANGLSVRETERLVKKAAQGEPAPKPARTKASSEKDADTRALEKDLSATLGIPVVIDHVAGQEYGQIALKYKNLEQLDDICRRLSNES